MPSIQFDQLIEAVEELPDDAQAERVDVIRRRLAERGRQRVIEDVQHARKEFAGQIFNCHPRRSDA